MSGPVAITAATLQRASEIVRRGGVVAFPTETYYGLAVDPFQPAALERLFAVKLRPADLPILVLVSGPEQLGLLAASVPPLFSVLIDRFWPGPLTLVCPARADLPARLTGDTGTVGVRQSPLAAANRLIAVCGGPITATSANLSGQPPAVTAAEVFAIFGDAVDLVLDGGPAPGGLGSTLVGVRAGRLHCLRAGVVPFAAVEACAAAPLSPPLCRSPMAELHWDKATALVETAGDEALLEELLSLFRAAAAGDLEQMRQAVTAGDVAATMAAAHSLKGAAASLGIESIRSLAETVEQAGAASVPAAARKALPVLADLLDQLAAL